MLVRNVNCSIGQKWDFLDPVLIKEIHNIVEISEGVLINKEQFPVLFEWNTKHIFSLPVHNALAERQFNIASMYLDPNMSEETIQATQLFVQNTIQKKGVNKLRTTIKTRREYKKRMIDYSKTVTHELIALAKSELTAQKEGTAEHSAPLKATDVAAERWDSLKEKGDTCVLIDNLQEQGRNLEVRWQSSTIRDKCYETEQSFKPTFAEDLFDKDKVKSLRVICASKIRRFGDQIKLDEILYECQILVKCLPKLLTPNSKEKNEAETSSTNNNFDNLADNGLLPRKRVLPSWMKQLTSELENRVSVTRSIVAEEGKDLTVV